MNVIKRSGREEKFNSLKIITVLQNANKDSVKPLQNETILDIVREISQECKLHAIDDIITTKDIQNILETELIKRGYVELAKKYIIGCYDNKLQYQMSVLDNKILSIIANTNKEVATENSNKNAKLITTQRDYMAGEISKSLAEKVFLSKDELEAHKRGVIHIHDMDYIMQPMLNCALINLEDMLNNGTNINGVQIDKPKSLLTAATIASQVSLVVSGSQFGLI